MAHCIGSLAGAKNFLTSFFASAAITDGQALVREATATNAGEAADPGAVTTAADFIGVAEDAASYNTAPTVEPGRNLVVATGLENLVRVNINPLAIFEFQVSGAAASGTVLVVTTTTPAHILTNDTADATGATITETAVGTVNMSGGLVKGLTGNNVGAIRKISAHTDNTSEGVTIGFVNTIAANDTFIRVPYGRTVQAMQFTTDFTQANGIIATGTGAPFRVVEVTIDTDRTLAWVAVVAGDHQYNPA